MTPQSAFWLVFNCGFAGFSVAGGMSGEIPALAAGSMAGINIAGAISWLVVGIAESD